MCMSDESGETPAWTSMGPLDRLQHSISNLLTYGSASPGIATVINVACILIGVSVWYATTGVVSWLGAGYAILCASGIIKWVFRL